MGRVSLAVKAVYLERVVRQEAETIAVAKAKSHDSLSLHLTEWVKPRKSFGKTKNKTGLLNRKPVF